MLNNNEVQTLFQEALDKLDGMTDDRKKAERLMAYVWIERMKLYSSSGNESPSLRGLGLETAIKLAKEVLANGVNNINIDWKSLSLEAEPKGFEFKLG